MTSRIPRIAKAAGLSAMLAAASAGANGLFAIGGGLADAPVKGLDDATGARAHAGFLFTEQYGMEIGYIDFGEFDVENAPSGNFVSVDGPYVALTGVNRLSPTTELTGKLGVLHYDSEATSRGRVVATADGTSALLGIGANFYLSKVFALGVEFTHVNDVEDEDINSLWLQLVVRFGED